MYVCMYVCMYVFLYVRMYVRMAVCMYVCVLFVLQVHAYMGFCIRSGSYVFVYVGYLIHTEIFHMYRYTCTTAY